jgi:hypothetical protein
MTSLDLAMIICVTLVFKITRPGPKIATIDMSRFMSYGHDLQIVYNFELCFVIMVIFNPHKYHIQIGIVTLI